MADKYYNSNHTNIPGGGAWSIRASRNKSDDTKQASKIRQVGQMATEVMMKKTLPPSKAVGK